MFIAMSMFKPDSYRLRYAFNQSKKTFTEFILVHAEKDLLTPLIRLEKNNGYNSITGADNLLRIRDKTNWSKCTLTGLRPTETPCFYYSDLPVNQVKSLIVVYISDNGNELLFRVCKQFYPKNPSQRAEIIRELIKNF